ncbi:hypothetical protein NB636_05170 [Oxalobacter aliiformigenes]|uniref:hypothetical protein n=1 Tax=Oxalobacter aliiformigenes TaxID=2946593 RepID=UPI0022B01516|nr:hypothetical protein [Oxalobacter aliiformigenes]MCZ4066022.1 hypothetical protein [Oxalobacter aliiformigenes]WAW00237.1 hypothetical protein NB636_05170 [Oxalobacter aliiformigenes]
MALTAGERATAAGKIRKRNGRGLYPGRLSGQGRFSWLSRSGWRSCVLRGEGASCPVIFFSVDDGFQPAGISVPLTVISVLGVRRLAGKEKSVPVPGARLPVFSRTSATAGAGMTAERNRVRQDGTGGGSIGEDACWFYGIS